MLFVENKFFFFSFMMPYQESQSTEVTFSVRYDLKIFKHCKVVVRHS